MDRRRTELSNPCRDEHGQPKCERLKKDPSLLPFCRSDCPLYAEHESKRIEQTEAKNRERDIRAEFYEYQRSRKTKNLKEWGK